MEASRGEYGHKIGADMIGCVNSNTDPIWGTDKFEIDNLLLSTRLIAVKIDSDVRKCGWSEGRKLPHELAYSIDK